MIVYKLPVKLERKYRLLIVAISLAIIFILSYNFYFAYAYIGSGPVEIEISTDKEVYLQGEAITFNVYVINPQNWRVPYPSEIIWGIDSNLANPPTSQRVDYVGVPSYTAHSKTNMLTYTWDQTLSGVQVPSGNYTFTYSMTGFTDYGPRGNHTVTIR